MGNQGTTLSAGKLMGGSRKARLIHDAIQAGSKYSAGEMWIWLLPELHAHLDELFTKKLARIMSGKN